MCKFVFHNNILYISMYESRKSFIGSTIITIYIKFNKFVALKHVRNYFYFVQLLIFIFNIVNMAEYKLACFQPTDLIEI